MHNYKITPKQPLLFRDGKPFGTDDNIADTLSFPLPSTISGAMRTAWAEDNNRDYAKAAKKSVCGPLLTLRKRDNTTLLFPAPADSLCLAPKQEAEEASNEPLIYRLRPEKIDNHKEGCNMPSGKLSPLFIQLDSNGERPKGKPAKTAPHYWHYNKMLDWLLDDSSNQLPAREQGIQSLPVETRTHVSINPETKTAEKGHLFQTTGLDFGKQRKQAANESKRWGWQNEELGLACQFQEEISDTLRTIGGESRLVQIEKQEDLIPECPGELGASINKARAFRLILVTPAIFKKGYLPDFINEESMEGEHRGMQLKLHAVAVPRWQAGTSWDMASAGSTTGKGMRSLKRLAPAGTVYWFEIKEGVMQTEGYWLTSISDERANDGYGLTLPGVSLALSLVHDKKL